MIRRIAPTITVANRQRRDPVPRARLSALARSAARRLRLRGPGTLSVVMVSAAEMRRLNARWTGHRGLTDVLSFRYPADGARGGGRGARDVPVSERVIGEIIVAPEAARRYARSHGVPYGDELARYVVHGLLHWAGHDDRTLAQQRKMRQLEDDLMFKSKVKTQKAKPQFKS